eukprot:Sdes_comp12294_c0_seq1m2980
MSIMSFSKIYSSVLNANTTTLTILCFVVFLLLLFTVLYLYLITKPTKAREAILLAGLSGAGKTLLYSQLVYKKCLETHTSIMENEANCNITWEGKTKQIYLIDTPGHERLRLRFIDDFTPIAKAILFVIDSVELHDNCRSVADNIYDILINTNVQKYELPILFVCNKQDTLTALGKSLFVLLLNRKISPLVFR